ncbi:FixH family protein [Bacillus sp. MMSF_3328]|uniref:FixH family protein n=1 Tax=Bacillus sp. MMSF_3328 TaxID=3047080 RepID=UPI00273D5E19|nr:FixH family protein [Bacillus sp. MMSF_3328]
MKRVLFLIVMGVLLGGCSLDDNAEELYKIEQPLQAEIMLPDSFAAGEDVPIRAVLTQNGEKVAGADYVHFEIWKRDGSVHFPMEEAADEGEGVYQLTKKFEQDGVYIIKVHASSAGSLIMPQKQFVVGELTEAELEELMKEGEAPSGSHEGHH